MITRALDATGDWIFGIGKAAYLSGTAAIMQDIQTRLKSVLGDCFFDLGAGVDWFRLLGGKSQTAIELQVASVILNTANVTGLVRLAVTVNPTTRNVAISYQVQTTYSTFISNAFQYDVVSGNLAA